MNAHNPRFIGKRIPLLQLHRADSIAVIENTAAQEKKSFKFGRQTSCYPSHRPCTYTYSRMSPLECVQIQAQDVSASTFTASNVFVFVLPRFFFSSIQCRSSGTRSNAALSTASDKSPKTTRSKMPDLLRAFELATKLRDTTCCLANNFS